MRKMKILKKTNIGIGIALMIFIVFTQFSLADAAKTMRMPNNSCVDCHRNLLFSSDQKKFIDMRIRHLEGGISCSIDCHEDRQNQSIDSSYALWSISTHYRFNVTCDKCHKGNPLSTSKNDSHNGILNISREDTPDICGKCHDSQLEEFKNSLHFKRLLTGEVPAPACITCHQSHSVSVLKAADLEDFCSNCHNNITNIDPTVPSRAQKALSLVADLRSNFSKVNNDLMNAEASGKNVSAAEIELDSARMIIKNIPSVWHRFNLTYFEIDVQQGINSTQQAEKLINNSVIPSTRKSPGFDDGELIIGLFILYFIKRINYKNFRK